MLKQKIWCTHILVRKKLFSKTILHHTTFLFLLQILKKVLYEKIKQKKTPVVYKTDKIANLHGHKVLRTAVRHCELNPIELIWVQVKGFMAKNNTTFWLKDVEELMYTVFGKITKDVWTKTEEHVVKIEKEYCKENCIDRSVIEPIIIDFCDDDDMGWSIIILSIIDREKNVKIE